MSNTITRRSFLAASLAIPFVGCRTLPNREPALIGETPLKVRAADKGLVFGAEVNPRELRNPGLRRLLIREADILVPGNPLKWGPLERHRGKYRFKGADAIARFAGHHNIAMRGHTLLWHDMIPPWLPQALKDPDINSRELVVEHIRTVAGRYRGRMNSWDVLNEGIEPDDGRDDGLRESLFLQALGPGYIELAFRTAAQADPSATLVLNEYGQEWGWTVGHKRRVAMLKLLEKLLAKGVPVHAVGIQGHLDPGVEGAIDLAALGWFCDEVSDLGLTIEITELDARDTSVNGSITARDRIVADAYAGFLDVVLARPATKALLTWGITDRHSWLSHHFPRADGDRVRGLPYDADYKRKPAWYALAAALEAAPLREPAWPKRLETKT